MEEKLKEILEAKGITGVSSITVRESGAKGEGMASVTKYITVKFKSPDKKDLNLFMKMLTDSESHSEMMNEGKAFEKEARFLQEYVPAAKKLCAEKGHADLADFYPKCYYGDENIIVLENLVLDKGYILLDKTERQDLKAASLATRKLACHHAISYAMIKEMQGPEKFFQRFTNLDLEAYNGSGMPLVMEPAFVNSLTTNIQILENNSVDGAEEAKDFLKARQGTPFMTLLEIRNSEPIKGEIFVLCHGDYWNNNMMFLRDETGEYIGHKAIDFQVTRYHSPVLDLSYFFFTSVKRDVRQKHLQELLEIYLDTFKKVTQDLGHPVDLTYEQLFHQFRKRFGFGYWFAVMVSVGPGLALLKNVDVNTIDMKEFPKVFTKLVRDYLETHPQESKGFAEELVSIVQEFKRLSL